MVQNAKMCGCNLPVETTSLLFVQTTKLKLAEKYQLIHIL